MALTPLTTDMDIIQKLPTQMKGNPNYTADIVKGLLDQGENVIKDYINGTLIPEIEAATIEVVESEAARVTAESGRETAETGRTSAEGERETAESGRVAAESARAAFYSGFNAAIAELQDKPLYENLQTIKTFSAGINFVGDSITYGSYAYGEIFVDKFRNKVNALFGTNVIPVRNMGVSGAATADFCLPTVLEQTVENGTATSDRNNLFIIGLGTNDIYSSYSSTTALIFKLNLRKLIEAYQNEYKNYVFLTVPIVCQVSEITEAFVNYKNAVYELAAEYGLGVIDYSTIDMTGLLADGIHPNTDGHQLMYEKIIEALSKREIANLKTPYSPFASFVPSYVNQYWNMDSLGQAEVDIVSSKNGIATGTTSVTGTFGKARKFNGTNGKIQIDNFDVPVNDFTLLFNIVDKGTVGANQYIFSCRSFAAFGVLKWGESVLLQTADGIYVTLCALSSIANGDKLALKVTGGNATLYINGVAQTPQAIGTIVRANSTFVIGGGQDGSSYRFDGAIDEVAYCDVLTAEQILAIATSTHAIIY